MAHYNIQPFYGGGNPSFPLSVAPYNSRVEGQELVFGDDEIDLVPKNYQFIAFRPGFPLQASELNEMQEHFQMQLTLSIAMMHNWITSGTGKHWGSYDRNNSGGEGSESVPSDVPENGIGVGGVSPNGVLGDSNYAISGPGWKGSCPLHPYHTPYIPGDGAGQAPVTAQFSTTGGGFVQLSFWSGWWLVELTDDTEILPGGSQLKDISGMKHWVYLTSSNPNLPAFTINVVTDPIGGNIEKVVGFKLSSDYYGCEPCAEGESPPCNDDTDLADNSAGFPNSIACGASRYGISFMTVGEASPNSAGVWSDTQLGQRQRLSLVCKVNPAEGTVRYMNNILIGQR